VRWYPYILYHSILIGDPDKATGWVHIETNLPYSKSNLRHSITIHRKKAEVLVLSFREIFEGMWKASEVPSDTGHGAPQRPLHL
jgi:hypothetical protein